MQDNRRTRGATRVLPQASEEIFNAHSVAVVCTTALIVNGSLSELRGTSGGLLDFVYFSAVVYTTLGLGDIIPSGAIRFMTGTEALTGCVLITWSASFTFLEMQKFWRN